MKNPEIVKFRGFLWAQMGLNHRPSDYESDALTNWAMGPNEQYKDKDSNPILQ